MCLGTEISVVDAVRPGVQQADPETLPAATKIAAEADVVVVCVGIDSTIERVIPTGSYLHYA